MAAPRRGVQDIPTLSGRGDVQPYKVYMQLSSLEMERARCEQDRRNAVAQIATIDARLKELVVKEQLLLGKLGKEAVQAVVEIQELTHSPELERKPGKVLRYGSLRG